MRSLLISLYAAVFVALLGLGWLIDQLYQRYSEAPPIDTHAGYREVLTLGSSRAAELLPNHEAAERFLAQLDVAAMLEPLSELPLPPPLAESLAAGKVIALASDDGVTLHRRVPGHDWVISLGPLAGDAPADDDARILMTLLFYSGVGAILLIWVTPLLRGVRQLSEAAKRIGDGELAARVDPAGSFQLAPLKRDFNAMAERLQRLSENHRLLSQAISHELRTPLARMRFALDMLASRKDHSARAADIEHLERDIDAMEALTAELLGFARFEKPPALSLQPVPFEEFLQQRIELWQEQGCRIDYQPSAASRLIDIDPTQLGKAIDNLLKNACQHALHQVAVRCEWRDDSLLLTVEDDGTGIPDGARERVFDPFHRLSDSERSKQGFGLGLAIARKVVEWHGGELVAGESAALGGAAFALKLPLGS